MSLAASPGAKPAAGKNREHALAHTRAWVDVFRERGFNPLPADETLRRPTYGYRQWWDSPVPDHVYDNHPTTCIQVMTGRFWGLLVIDLDGEGAQDRFGEIARGRGPLPRTWICKSGGGGLHYWWSIPKDFPRRLAGGPLWVGEGKHNRIDRICDHGLIVAPPSIHHRTGKQYVWKKGCSPLDIPMPAKCPGWLLNYPTEHEKRRMERRDRVHAGAERFAHLDKIGKAKSWGVRFTGSARNGWHECHSPFRDDSNPSAAIHEESGYYVDLGAGAEGRMSFPELAVAIGVYPTVEDAIREMGR